MLIELRGLSTHAVVANMHKWGEGAFLDLSYSIPTLSFLLAHGICIGLECWRNNSSVHLGGRPLHQKNTHC